MRDDNALSPLNVCKNAQTLICQPYGSEAQCCYYHTCMSNSEPITIYNTKEPVLKQYTHYSYICELLRLDQWP